MRWGRMSEPMIDLDSIDAPAFLVEVLPDGQFRYARVNAASRLRTGIGDELISGRTPKECLEPALAVRVLQHFAECVERGGIVEYDGYAQFPAGSMDWRTWLVPIRQMDGRVTHLLGICSDLMLADRRRDLHDKNMQLSLALQALKGASWTYDGETGRYAASDAFALLMGEERSRPVSWAEWCARILPSDLPAALCDRLIDGQAEGDVVLFRFRRTDGEERWAQCRRVTIRGEYPRCVCGVVVDVTEERWREQALLDLASRDPLTGLLNRRGFKREVERAVLSSSACPEVILLLVDIDRFKSTNDTFGHPTGDAVLVEVGRRLPQVFGADAVCARLGGDEFAVLRPMLPGDVAEDFRAAIASAMACPLVHSGNDVPLSASVGFAVAHADVDLGELMAHADEALYAEKRSRRRKLTLAA